MWRRRDGAGRHRRREQGRGQVNRSAGLLQGRSPAADLVVVEADLSFAGLFPRVQGRGNSPGTGEATHFVTDSRQDLRGWRTFFATREHQAGSGDAGVVKGVFISVRPVAAPP